MTARIVKHSDRTLLPHMMYAWPWDADLRISPPRYEGQLWTREAERSARFDREGFDSFSEINCHAALAREAAEASKLDLPSDRW